MKPLLLGLMALLLACCATDAVEEDTTFDTLIAAERSFARASVADGMRASFLTVLADSAVIFRPGPVEGRAWFSERPSPSGTLNWWPRYGEVSSAGDLGFTTGPWLYSDSAGTPVAYGHYVSVWQRQSPGTWKVALDAGITHSQSFAFDSTVARPEKDRVMVAEDVDLQEARTTLQQADQTLSLMLDENAPDSTALMAFWADDVRVYRESRVPVQGKDALRDAQAGEMDSLQWIPVASDVAQSGDLGYSYGAIRGSAAGGENAEEDIGGYLRIWRRGTSGAWVVVLDLASAVQ